MSTSGFWTGSPTVDPTRQFRFKVTINGKFIWWAKTCDKPKVNIPVLGKDEYYLNSPLPDLHPGEIIDPAEPHEAASIISQLSAASNGVFPRIGGQALKDQFGIITISQLDSKGKVLETWTLHDAFPTSIDFGSLDYGSDEFVEITMTFEYTAFEVATKSGKNIIPLSRRAAPKTKEEAKKLDGGLS